jgi:hypothetical protein
VRRFHVAVFLLALAARTVPLGAQPAAGSAPFGEQSEGRDQLGVPTGNRRSGAGLCPAVPPRGKRSPVRQVEVPISIPRQQALTALGQYYLYEVKLTLKPGEQHVAITVQDEATATTSYLTRTLQVGAPGKPAAPAL